MGLSVSTFLSSLKECLGWPYKSPGGTGKDCSQTGIDCSGMLVRAYKLAGLSIFHGSNSIWRDGSLTDKGVLTSVSQLKPGYAVFLRKDWKEKDSSNKYYNDSVGNMSHVGVVLSVNPLCIIEASYSAGKVRTTDAIRTVGWTHWGQLKKVDYGTNSEVSNEETIQTSEVLTAKVIAESGSTVNLRARANKKSGIQFRVPIGSEVTILSEKLQNGFYKVQYSKWKGYIMKEFLEVNS